MIKENRAKTVPYSLRLPFYSVERCKIHLKNDQVVASSEDGDQIETLPVAAIALLLIGPGCSITSEAARVAALRGCTVSFSGGAGVPVFSHTVAYRSPTLRIKQVRSFTDPIERLRLAKLLLSKRAEVVKRNTGLPPLHSEEFSEAGSVEAVMLAEARWAKTAYASCRLRFGVTFTDKRQNPTSLLNHMLYSIMMSACLHLGLDPNLGVIHSPNRGGGLVFDLADVWKPTLTWETSYEWASANFSSSKMKALFLQKVRKLKATEYSIELMKELIC